MLEIPELFVLTDQMNKTITAKKVLKVFAPTKVHKFCWFNNDPSDYEKQIIGSSITTIETFGMFLDIQFSNKKHLLINDGVHPQYFENTSDTPKDFQCKIDFTDKSSLVFTVGMYGGIYLYEGTFENEYFESSKNAISPFNSEFNKYFDNLINKANLSLSLKALLATDQRIPGIGNGVIQDILFDSKLNPKKKVLTCTKDELNILKKSLVKVLKEMIKKGGRDTEKDLFGKAGGYKTKLSKNSLSSGCPSCSTQIVKEAFLGGSIYYCPKCQVLPPKIKTSKQKTK